MVIDVAGGYLVRPLTDSQITQAFAVVSMLDLELSMDQWVGYAAALAAPNGDPNGHRLLSVQSGQGHIYGVSAYWLKPDLRRDRILEIENFAVVDVTGTRRAARALLEGLEDLAKRQECSCIVVSLLSPVLRRRLRDEQAATADLFRETGFRGDHLRLRKCFENGA
ncbi:MAG: hypothetical protein GWO02_10885 [Gammaproteobacteria bacterium]|nr:hypothetical protein [Gammaproteobacteria bacterium]